jgi:hypothetical protein
MSTNTPPPGGRTTPLNLYPNKIPQQSLKEFIESGTSLGSLCSQSKTPVLITGVYEVFPELVKWTPDFLDQKVGNKAVQVISSETGVFQEHHHPLNMTLREYSREINVNHSTAKRHLYMGALNIDHFFPEIKADLQFDELLPQEINHSELWYGPGGNTTGLHYDAFSNFFIQLYGQKRWLLSEPNSFLNLYPRSALSNYPKNTDFNPLKPDFEKYPKAKKVQFYDLTIQPDSILFVPPYWWHQVSSFNMSISVSIWCKTNLLKAEWGALQLLPTHIKHLMGQIVSSKRH